MIVREIRARLRTRRLPRYILDLPLGVWFVLAALALLPIAYIVDHRNEFFEVMDSILLAGIIGVQIACAKASWRVLTTRPPKIDIADAFLFSFAVQLFGLAIMVSGLWYWRFMDRPDQFENSLYWLFGRWVMFIGFFYMLCVIWSSKGIATGASVAKTAIYTSAAVGLALMALTLTR